MSKAYVTRYLALPGTSLSPESGNSQRITQTPNLEIVQLHEEHVEVNDRLGQTS